MNDIRSFSEEGLTFRDYLNHTFLVMGLGLLVSSVFAYLGGVVFKLIPPSIFFIVMLVCLASELIVALIFGARLMKMSKTTAWICYFIYCALTGITLSVVLEVYTASSAAMAFVSTLILFICMAIIGHTTRVDLSKFGPLLSVGLLTIIIVSIINALFLHMEIVSIGVCYLGVFIFLGLIAYDVRRLRDLYNQGLSDNQLSEKLMIYGAFQLYLDFINLFLRLLEIFGKRRD